MYNTPYNRWLWGSCCCESHTTQIGDCDKDCSCEAIYLEISNLKTTDNVISGEVAEKQDKLIAGDNITISGNVISAVGGEGISSGDVQTMIENNLDGYATEQWVEGQGYLTEHQSLSGYATEQWVEDKHYITGVDLSNYATLQDIPTVPTNVSSFVNDAHYVTSGDSVFNNYATTANTYTKTEVNNLVNNKFWCGTQQEYNALVNKENGVLYLIHN